MKEILVIVAPILILAAISIQWNDCRRNYGNTMGVYSLINTMWLLAGIAFGIGISGRMRWYSATGIGILIFVLYYPITLVIEKIGTKFKPINTKNNGTQP